MKDRDLRRCVRPRRVWRAGAVGPNETATCHRQAAGQNAAVLGVHGTYADAALVVTAPASSRKAAAAIVSGFYRRRRASTRPGVGLHGNSNNETIPRARHHFIHA
eukprot:CAMPEP_0119478068 /NCGR_PEP_ID=MMETSP1344-20130328/7981_1 /TAXON_ID=236787 /ORGANISM="Florenciella parvula, Strain CCMP2471" /LENGTH=104 /DNA_ID=CAMNT_0007512213 /DNA_START=293 /DNA_END=606 /DNA_ORIENTATION=+